MFKHTHFIIHNCIDTTHAHSVAHISVFKATLCDHLILDNQLKVPLPLLSSF